MYDIHLLLNFYSQSVPGVQTKIIAIRGLMSGNAIKRGNVQRMKEKMAKMDLKGFKAAKYSN